MIIKEKEKKAEQGFYIFMIFFVLLFFFSIESKKEKGDTHCCRKKLSPNSSICDWLVNDRGLVINT